MNWKEELNLLNDDQLKRVVYADKDSWAPQYSGNPCCIMGHILDLPPSDYNERLFEYRYSINRTNDKTELQLFYDDGWICIDSTYPDFGKLQKRVEIIQNEAKRILEERKQRVSEQIVSKEIVEQQPCR